MSQRIRQQTVFSRNSKQQPFVLVQPVERQSRDCCAECGARLRAGTSFCTDCGAPTQADGALAIWLKARPTWWRRMVAEWIDRFVGFALAPVVVLPLTLVNLHYYFWLSGGVIFFWHLLRDCSPQRRSFGKRQCGLRVVTAGEQRQCHWWQALLRRLLSALSQACYTLAAAALLARLITWETLERAIAAPWPAWAASNHFIPLLLLLPLIYDLISLAGIWISPDARRLEDYLCGTQVILEEAYARDRETCGKCGQLVPSISLFCHHCGEPKMPELV
jgi:uncharacterized RDD family membrane protein YckC